MKEEKGITLIALIITIIVLLILAMVSVSMVINYNLLGKVQEGTQKYKEAEYEEAQKANNMATDMDLLYSEMAGQYSELDNAIQHYYGFSSF